MSVAAKVAWWDRWLPGGLTPSRSSGPSFATAGTPVGPKVEIFVDSAWTDISPDVRYADRIQITNGRPDESSRTQPSTCRFTLNNQGGRYSPRNPVSPLYGKIGRNTRVRVSVDQVGITRYRFYGEIVAWPQQWDLTGNDVYVPIEAAGPLRRLNQGSGPLRSSLYRGTIRSSNQPIAYWPCEDGAGAEFMASAISGARDMTISGTPVLADYTGFISSDALPTMGTGSFKGIIPPYTSTGLSRVEFALAIPAAGATTGQVLCSLSTTGSARRWDLYYVDATGQLGLKAFDSDGTLLQDSGTLGGLVSLKGENCMVDVKLTETGSDVSALVRVDYISLGGNTSVTTLFTGMTVARMASVIMAPGRGLTDTAIGHVTISSSTSSPTSGTSALFGYIGERPYVRLARLAQEEGLDLVVLDGGLTDTITRMGYQSIKTLVDLMQECVDADLGVLYEARDAIGFEYRTRLSLYNQTEVLALSYTASDLFEVPIPVDDDQLSRNDITVKRDLGSSARAVLESGPLSVLPPPDGIGLYDDDLTINLEDDSTLLDQANWRLNLGTVDEPRYPTVTVHLKRSTFTASYGLTASALLISPGDRYLVTDVPAWLPPGDISQILNSYTESIDQFEHVITFNGAPESPWRVAILDSASLGKADTDGSVLTSAVGDSDSSMSVTTTSGPVWVDSATYPTEFPFDVSVGGEVMSVTAVAGTTSPQTFTVTRSVNGIVKSQVAGEDIRLAQPMTLSL